MLYFKIHIHMQEPVSDHGPFLFKASPTNVTFIRGFSSMDSNMPRVVPFQVKRFLAVFTLVLF